MTAADQLRARLIRPDARSSTKFAPHAVLSEEEVYALADALDGLERAVRPFHMMTPGEIMDARDALARVAAALGDTQEEAD